MLVCGVRALPCIYFFMAHIPTDHPSFFLSFFQLNIHLFLLKCAGKVGVCVGGGGILAAANWGLKKKKQKTEDQWSCKRSPET